MRVLSFNNNIIDASNRILYFNASVGSVFFSGNTSSDFYLNNDIDFRMGTGDFTIEWWQYQTDNNSFPRIFSIGDYPTASIGASIEGGVFYFWAGGSANSFGSVVPHKNAWVHFAITRESGGVRVFKNGQQISTTRSITTDFNNTSSILRVGNESTSSSQASFGGYITNFHWVKGVSKYNSDFNVPTSSTLPLPNSRLLLLARTSSSLLTDSSDYQKSPVNNGVSWSPLNPF